MTMEQCLNFKYTCTNIYDTSSLETLPVQGYCQFRVTTSLATLEVKDTTFQDNYQFRGTTVQEYQQFRDTTIQGHQRFRGHKSIGIHYFRGICGLGTQLFRDTTVEGHRQYYIWFRQHFWKDIPANYCFRGRLIPL